MNLKDTLLAMSDDARGWLKTWAAEFTDAESVSAGGTRTNPMAWHMGHIACTEDWAYQIFSGKAGAVDPGLSAICGNSCPEPTAATRYPTVAELWTLLDRTHTNWTGVVSAAAEADFDKPPLVENPFFKTLGQTTFELALHENYHVGVIATLRKALGKKKIG